MKRIGLIFITLVLTTITVFTQKFNIRETIPLTSFSNEALIDHISSGIYAGENPSVNLHVINQDTIIDFVLKVEGSGWYSFITRDSVVISGDSIYLSTYSSNRKYTVTGKFNYELDVWEGSYYYWSSYLGDIDTKSGTWAAILVLDTDPPYLYITEDSLYQPYNIEVTSSEDGVIYLVPEGIDRDLKQICEACIDSLNTSADSTINIPLSGLANGEYWIYGKDSAENVSSPMAITIMGVGIENTMTNQFRIYPNPTNTFLTIETGSTDQYNIQITSLNGQLIFNTKFEGTSHQIDLSSFQKGAYLITIRSKDFVTTRKIIKL